MMNTNTVIFFCVYMCTLGIRFKKIMISTTVPCSWICYSEKNAKLNVTQHFITVSQLQYIAFPDW